MTKGSRSVLALVLISTTASCNISGLFDSWGEDVSLPNGQSLKNGYQIGDTVTFVASEHCVADEGGDCPAVAPSNLSPSSYHWFSSDERVAAILNLATIRMVGIGLATITVNTVHGSGTFNIQVIPRLAGVRITPKTTTFTMGDSASVEIVAVDSLGNSVPGISGPKFIFFERADNLSNPVAQAFGVDLTHYMIKGLRSGTQSYGATLSVFNVAKSADTLTVIVK
jgi:hypothetical protein